MPTDYSVASLLIERCGCGFATNEKRRRSRGCPTPWYSPDVGSWDFIGLSLTAALRSTLKKSYDSSRHNPIIALKPLSLLQIKSCPFSDHSSLSISGSNSA
ncbi:MAG: hypothetical protein V7754_22295, partial [Halioglobus sp.]